jgi:hypothetical protein
MSLSQVWLYTCISKRDLILQFKDQMECEHQIIKIHQHIHTLQHDEFNINTYHVLSKHLSDQFQEQSWKENDLVHTKKKLNELQKRQGFNKVAHAFMVIGALNYKV